MIRNAIIFVSILLFFACSNSDEDNSVSHTMEDGMTFNTDGMAYYYDNSDSFIGIKEITDSSRDSIMDFQKWEKDSVYGYDKEEILKWEEVSFGKWVEKYGLDIQKKYFVSTIKIMNIISIQSGRTITCRGYDVVNKDSIGLNTITDRAGFVVSNNSIYGLCDAYTILKKIEYDENGKKVSIYFPVSPSNLKWIFYTTKNIW